MRRTRPGAGAAGTAAPAPPPRLPRGYAPNTRLGFAPGTDGPQGDTLVVVFLRGAADGLNMVIPHAEEAYHRLRPSLRLPRPDQIRTPAEKRTIDLDGFFGFHPALRPLLPTWGAGHLACLQACGAPDQSRSHFKAMELMERGTDRETGPASGWIGRHLSAQENGSSSTLRALSLGDGIPRSLYGPVPAAALRSITTYHLGDSQAAGVLAQALSAFYSGADPLSQQGRESLDALHTLEKLDPASYISQGSPYPETEFGQGLAQIAMLVKAEVGLETAAIDLGGWDTHFAQGVLEGQMPRLLADLAGGLAAFHSDLGEQLGRVTLVVMTEFGRRAYENASLGTDHGHGSIMLLLGGGVRGGRVVSSWPGLEEENLVGPGDLAVTIDYRDVLAEMLAKRMHAPDLSRIFPDFLPQFPGVIQG